MRWRKRQQASESEEVDWEIEEWTGLATLTLCQHCPPVALSSRRLLDLKVFDLVHISRLVSRSFQPFVIDF